MTLQLFRFAYICEFLLALTTIFTVWPEIGGVAALELMHWGFKLGFGVALACGFVALTRTVVHSERLITWASIGWLAALIILAIGMGVVTYYYTLQEESGDLDEPSATVTISYPCTPSMGAYS
jgi:hypothetical protein